jgi:hypothetical protein
MTIEIRWARRRLAVALTASLALVFPALAADAYDDPLSACDRAAVQAEADWHLPAGLLAAIGTVESGRGDLGSTLPVAWPWSIDAGGRDFYLSSKSAAIQAVRALQAGGWRTIDIGCFQVDLFYHPTAFATLDVAFDPGANAQAAARILADAHVATGSWDAAVALYHSASPVLGVQYLRRVRAVWPWARTRSVSAQEDGYVILASAAARQVKVVTVTDAPPPQRSDLPRVLGPQDAPAALLQWTAAPQHSLPVDLTPAPEALSYQRHRPPVPETAPWPPSPASSQGARDLVPRHAMN